MSKKSNGETPEKPVEKSDLLDAAGIPTAHPTDSEGLPILKKKRHIRNLISGAEFHDFEQDSTIVYGRYIGPVKREKDGQNVATNPNEKAGTVMGYQVTEILDFDTPAERDGGYTIIGASEQINRGFERAQFGELYRVEFMGKTTNAKGQPVNRFRVDIIEEL